VEPEEEVEPEEDEAVEEDSEHLAPEPNDN